MIWLFLHPSPISKLSSILSLSVCRQQSLLKDEKGTGEEPNHTTAGKLGPL
jgi:hypothetical protein